MSKNRRPAHKRQDRAAAKSRQVPSPGARSKQTRRIDPIAALKLALIVAAAFWIYWPSLGGDWLWDDDILITDNAVVHDPMGIFRIWLHPESLFDYLPLKVTLEWLEWQVWGDAPMAFRIVNLALHVTGALLVWRLLGKFGLKWAWLGALIFTVHPIMVESAAWIAELKNTLSLPIFLCAMCAWIDFENERRARDYWLALGLFVAAMLCKATMVMFPAVILLYAWWKRGRIGWNDVKVSAPFFAVSLVLGAVTIWFLHLHAMDTHPPHLGGVASRIACAGLVLAFYFSKAVLPVALAPIYPLWIVDPPTLAQFLPWPVFAGVFFYLWKRRGGWGRHALLGLGFFVLNLLPFLGLTAGSYMSFTWAMDHILYLPMVGLTGLAVAGWEHLQSLLAATGRRLAAGALAAVILLMAWGSHEYAKDFSSQEELWSYTLQANPDAWLAHIDLGNAFYRKGRHDEAFQQYEEALRLRPDLAEAYYNKGLAFFRSGKLTEAIANYEKAVAISPNYVNAHTNLGVSLAAAGKPNQAIAEYRKASALDPNFAGPHSNLGELLTEMKNYEEAERELKLAVELEPGYADAHYNLGNVYFLTGRLPDAAAEYKESLRLKPANASAHNNLGAVYEHMRRFPEAIEQFQQALQLNPGNDNARANLQRVQEESGMPGVAPRP